MNFEFIIIGIIFTIQLLVFVTVLKRIRELGNYFPKMKNLSIRNKEVEVAGNEGVICDYIAYQSPSRKRFNKIIESTNSYLINNKGSAADFNIIRDITERHIDTLINNINSTISAPLYLGLAGTFFGIIYGLSLLDFGDFDNGVSVMTTDSIGYLIKGVVVAMIASAAGLIFTLVNSSWFYKEATYKNEIDKNSYYDFIQSQLLPKLSRDVSDSLGSLKSNLDHFNNDFGENLINYKESFSLLNDNLTKEKEFLEAVKEIGLTKLSTQIIKTFEQVNDASNEFHDFQQYQTELNKNISSSIAILKEYNDISTTFSKFNINLDKVTDHIVESSDFYHEFKGFLESHFTEVENRANVFANSIELMDKAIGEKISELTDSTVEQKEFYNEQWRSTVDVLNKDIVELFSKMTDYIQNEASALKKYITTEEEGLQKVFESNKEFFKDFRYVEQLFNKFSSHAEITHTHQSNIEDGLEKLMGLLSNEASIINVNKNLIEIKVAINTLSNTLLQQKQK